MCDYVCQKKKREKKTEKGRERQREKEPTLSASLIGLKLMCDASLVQVLISKLAK